MRGAAAAMAAAMAILVLGASPSPVLARKAPPAPPSATVAAPSPAAPAAAIPTPPAAVPAAPVPAAPPAETVEIDVSMRTVAVTSVFGGTQIVVFGTVVNSRQPSAQSGYYDLVVTLEGRSAPTVVRRKSSVAGLWINTDAVTFAGLPLYSAIASTRPLDAIADARTLAAAGIGFAVPRPPIVASADTPDVAADAAYRTAAIRLKERDGLYVRQDTGVAFIGPALFRAGVALPANIPVGPLEARAYVFRDGRLLASKTVSVALERQGLDRLVYDFAFDHPVWYGLATVALAVAASLAATTVFRR